MLTVRLILIWAMVKSVGLWSFAVQRMSPMAAFVVSGQRSGACDRNLACLRVWLASGNNRLGIHCRRCGCDPQRCFLPSGVAVRLVSVILIRP